MTSCEHIRSLLNDEIDGRLDAAAHAQVAAHLATCADCLAERNALASLVGSARELPGGIEPPHDLWPRIADRLEAPSALSGLAARSAWRARTAYLPQAAMAVAACLALVLLWPSRSPHEHAGDSPIPNDLVTLDTTYEHVRASLDKMLVAGCDRLSDPTCSDLKSSVQTLDESAAAAHDALSQAGGSPRETMLLINTYQLTIDRARGLASRLARI